MGRVPVVGPALASAAVATARQELNKVKLFDDKDQPGPVEESRAPVDQSMYESAVEHHDDPADASQQQQPRERLTSGEYDVIDREAFYNDPEGNTLIKLKAIMVVEAFFHVDFHPRTKTHKPNVLKQK